MASNTYEPATSPAFASDYGYVSSDAEQPGLVEDLEPLVEGDVRFDTYTRTLYTIDASVYGQVPIGIIIPTSTADVAAVMEYCADREISVLPRGGGTSLVGQTVNKAVVLDLVRHMGGIEEVDPEARTATAKAGVRLDELNEGLAPHGLGFAPDPAWGDRSTLRGAVGNDSTGSHSLKYGKTDYYIEELEVVLTGGTVTTFGKVGVDELREFGDPDNSLEARVYAKITRILNEETDETSEHFPNLERSASGYNLDMLVDEMCGERHMPDDTGIDEDWEAGRVNLGRLIAGSGGILGIVTKATVLLGEIPNTASVVLLTYDDVINTMHDVAPILKHEPAVVEVMNDMLLDLARDTVEFADVVGMLPEETDSTLLVEFYADSDSEGKQKVADLIGDRVIDPGRTEFAPGEGSASVTGAERRATDSTEAHDTDIRAKFWEIHKSGFPILLDRTTDEKYIAHIEDTVIPAENLPAYILGFRGILDGHDILTSYYAHTGPGILHIRPLINTKTAEGVGTFEAITDEVTDLVVKYGDSISGKHNDGHAQTQWNHKLYGNHLWNVSRDLKAAFDPGWLLDLGNIYGGYNMTENLRLSPDYEFEADFEPTLNWDNDGGFEGMVGLCHGCAGRHGQQSTVGGVMCPTFRTAEEEIQTTRDRANMLRQAMSDGLPGGGIFTGKFVDEVLDLCVGRKGCSRDCPGEVNMAKMKAEVVHEYHQRNGSSLHDGSFANIDSLSKLRSAFAPLANAAMKVPGAQTIMERTVGIAKGRLLPTFHSTSLVDWFESRGGVGVPKVEADRKALLFPGTYTNYNHPKVGETTMAVLEAANIHVRIPGGVADSGRPSHSKGFLDKARANAEQDIEVLAPSVEGGQDIALCEPSDAMTSQSSYLDLLPGDDVKAVSANAYGVIECVDTFRLGESLSFHPQDDSLTYHGYCHQKSTKKDHHAVNVLRRADFEVDPLGSMCCGMSGSFGYEAEHYSMSKAIENILESQVAENPGDVAVVPDASYRAQLEDTGDTTDDPPHPVEVFARAIDA